MKVFILVNDFSQLLAEIFELPSSILTFNTLSLQSLNLSILILDDIVESFYFSGSHFKFKLILIDSDGSLSEFSYFFLQDLVLTPNIFELRPFSIEGLHLSSHSSEFNFILHNLFGQRVQLSKPSFHIVHFPFA